MKPSTKIILPSALALGFLLTACDNDKITPELSVPVKDNVSFALDIQPILSGQCAGCHNPGNVNPDLRKEVAFSSLLDDGKGIVPGDSEGSELVEMLQWKSADGKNMPPAMPLSPLQIGLIKKWIDEGAQNN
ncbi:MAG: hypothetical protein JSS79_04965 [Bacteroidetes bacterium]|nr:hypothetical protein [Bacteroidota bacterium]